MRTLCGALLLVGIASCMPPTMNIRSQIVDLHDYRIEMPSTLPAGPTNFTVYNRGEHLHNFEIEGMGIEKKLDFNLRAGEGAVLYVDLKPGTYYVYCPVGDHAARGMAMNLTVN